MNKTLSKNEAIAIILLLTLSAFAIVPLSQAKTVDYTITTYAYLQASPNPVGIGQTINLAMWIDKVPPTAGGNYGDRWVGFTIKVTLPDGTTANIGPFTSDAAGGAPAQYVPTQLGNYTFVLSFPGETLTGSTGTGVMTPTTAAIGNVYASSTSAPAVITVQQDPVGTIPENPIPTDYWQSPVEGFNHNWYMINGNWLGTASQSIFGQSGSYSYFGNYNPYTQAVLAPHILWTLPMTFGGQLGGPFIGDENNVYNTGVEYQPKFSPIIMNNVLYFQSHPTSNANPGGWYAINLRTGQQIWTLNTTDYLLCGQTPTIDTPNQYGGFAYLWGTKSNGFASPSYGSGLDMFDAFTGKYILTITPPPTGTLIVGDNGELLYYFVNSTTNTLNAWNSTLCIGKAQPNFFSGAGGTGGSWLPPLNGNFSYVTGIQQLSTLPTSYNGNNITLSIATIDPTNDVAVMKYGTAGAVTSNTTWAVLAGINIGTPTNLGGMKWITNQTTNITPLSVMQFGPAADGVFCEFTEVTMTWCGFSSLTGQQMWGPTEPYSNPLGYYFYPGVGIIAYGNLYTWTFGGQVYCYNLTTGATQWVFNTGSTELNNPYGVNVFWPFGGGMATIADGVFYVATGHNYGPPLFSGAKTYAINATTGGPDSGKLIWSFLTYGSASSLPVAQGEMISYNMYDNQIYAFGKGNTATTVTNSPAMNSNDQILITGTVTDQSPGQTCLGIPAAGTPAIADESMSQWMAYLFEQSPKPMNATGVRVTLTYVDPNNNTGTIGTTTSDINGQYSYAYTLPIPGTYKIIATFGGSNSYYSSTGQTSLQFNEPAPTATSAPTPATSVADTYFVPAIAGLFVLIVVVLALVTIQILRKRP